MSAGKEGKLRGSDVRVIVEGGFKIVCFYLKCKNRKKLIDNNRDCLSISLFRKHFQ